MHITLKQSALDQVHDILIKSLFWGLLDRVNQYLEGIKEKGGVSKEDLQEASSYITKCIRELANSTEIVYE